MPRNFENDFRSLRASLDFVRAPTPVLQRKDGAGDVTLLDANSVIHISLRQRSGFMPSKTLSSAENAPPHYSDFRG